MPIYESGHEGINVDQAVSAALLLAGGLTGQILTKISNDDWGYGWFDPGALPGDISAENLTLSQSLYMVNTINDTIGTIVWGGSRFIHNFTNPVDAKKNVFLGVDTGNVTSILAGGFANVGIGYESLIALTTGQYNVAIGDRALFTLTTAGAAVGIGRQAGYGATGADNVFVGSLAGNAGGSGGSNVGIGSNALNAFNAGLKNVAIGFQALKGASLVGAAQSYNVGVGADTLMFLAATSTYNVAVGFEAGRELTDGTSNILIGRGTNAPLPVSDYKLNIGDLIFGDLSLKYTGITTEAPHFILDLGTTVATAVGDAAAKKLAVYADATGGDFYGLGAVVGVFSGLEFHAGASSAALPGMLLTPLGNVGIGITNPDSYYASARMLVVGNSSGDGGITIRSSDTTTGILCFADGEITPAYISGFVQYDHVRNEMNFGIQNVGRVMMDANAIGIGVGGTSGIDTVYNTPIHIQRNYNGLVRVRVNNYDTDTDAAAGFYAQNDEFHDMIVGIFGSGYTYRPLFADSAVLQSSRAQIVIATTNDPDPIILAINSVEVARFESTRAIFSKSIYINETLNVKMTTGLTINQGTADDEILAFKSGDVAHGVTDITETDTYALFKKGSPTEGGLLIWGLSEGTNAIWNYPTATVENTLKTSAANGHFVISAYTKSLATVVTPGANANLFVIKSGSTSVFVVDAEGDTWQAGDAEVGSITIADLKSLYLPRSTDWDEGILFWGGFRFMHQSTDPASNVFNVYIGYNAGHVIPETGCYGNIGIGHQSMYNNKKGQSNIAMGVNTLYNITTATNCVMLGPTAGLNISSATGVMGIGSNSCRDITTGSYNTGIGFSTCRYMKEGPYNIGIGYFAGAGDAGNLTGGSYNISIGTNSGLALADGASNNTFIGPSAGKLVTTGSFNVLIGVNVEPTAPTSSYKLNIGDLIFGDLAVTKRAGINQSAPWAVLHVTGLQSNTTYRAIVRIDDDAGQAEGVGGGILFGYKHTDAGGSTYGPGIRAYKENSTSGNTEAGLRLLTRGVSGLVQAMSISSDGDVTIDGQIRQAIAWDDQQVDIGSVGLGSSAPTWVAYKGGKVLSFSATQDNGINFTSQLTHKYAQGEDIEFHIHLAYPDANVGNSKWTLTYSWANIGVAFPTETSVSKVISSALLTDGHQLGELVATIDGTGKNISSALICSLTREGTDGTDTYASATYLVALDFHVPVNSIGSDQESSKV